MKALIFVICRPFLFLHDLMRLLQRIEGIYYLFLVIEFFVAFFLQSGEPIYDPPRLKLVLLHLY